jgi:hypothetical protein
VGEADIPAFSKLGYKFATVSHRLGLTANKVLLAAITQGFSSFIGNDCQTQSV